MPKDPAEWTDGNQPDTITLYSSRRSWGFAIMGSVALIGAPLAVATTRSLGGLGIGALVVGMVATAALLLDQPLRSVVSADGIDRRCPLAHRMIKWSEIESLDRLRRSGGVVAKVGRRRLVLCDRSEGHFENLHLVEIAEMHGPNVIVRLEPPAIDARPTDLYRRRSE